MAYWDDKKQKIVCRKPKPSQNYPGWDEIDCGCCNGVKWGGLEPRECKRCNGSGILFHHLKSGVLALYPSGPLRGRY